MVEKKHWDKASIFIALLFSLSIYKNNVPFSFAKTIQARDW